MSENRRITFLIGVVLTVLVLVWGNPPSRGMVTSSFLLLSFAFFYNSLTLTRRVIFLRKRGDYDEEHDVFSLKKAEKIIEGRN
ncbi:hypothetical protein ES705_38352 [subsurface metagenome]